MYQLQYHSHYAPMYSTKESSERAEKSISKASEIVSFLNAHSSSINFSFDQGDGVGWVQYLFIEFLFIFQFPIFHLIFARIHGIFDIKKIPIPNDVQSRDTRPSNSCTGNALCSFSSNLSETKKFLRENCKEIIKKMCKKLYFS